VKGKLRLCLLTETYYPVAGGGEIQARTLAEGLAAQGNSVVVLCRRSHQELPPFEKQGGVSIYRLPPTGSHHLNKWALLLSSFPALVRRRHDYDLIFVSGFRVLGVVAVAVALILGKVCILKADSLGEMSGAFFAPGLAKIGMRPATPLFALLLRLRNAILRRAGVFVAISTAVKSELIAAGILPERIHCIPNSVDTARFRPLDRDARADLRRRLDLSPGAPVVVYTGRLVTYKGLPGLLAVWPRIQAQFPRSRLLLVGEGGLDIHNCEAELRAFVAEQGLGASVIFTGRVSNVHEYLQAADIFVFPSEEEAFGISLLEAMACELPVIGTAVGGLQDLLRHCQNALVVPPRDGRALERALRLLLANPDLAQRLGRTALADVHQQYAEPTVLAQYLSLFSELARPAPQRR
jgi:glycosyltransferase involved in cell wall biosynthesis